MKVNLSEFHGLLTDIVRTSSADATIPMIYGVLLYGSAHEGSDVLVAESTDRYVLGQAYMSVEGEFGTWWVPLASVKALLTAVKPHVRHRGLWDVSIDHDTMTVDLPAGSVSVAVNADINFPKLARFFTSELKPASAVALRPELVEKFVAVAKRRKCTMRLELAEGMKTQRVFIGDHYRGVVMPVVLESEAPVSPVFERPES